jgi:hypothetical protein
VVIYTSRLVNVLSSIIIPFGQEIMIHCCRPESVGSKNRIYVSENFRNPDGSINKRITEAMDEIDAVAVEDAHLSRLDLHTIKKPRVNNSDQPAVPQISQSIEAEGHLIGTRRMP